MTDLKQIFEARRSINFFDSSKPLGDKLLEQIINLATTCPSAYNLQPWRVIAVRSDEGKKLLYELGSRQDKFLNAPVTLLIVGDREGYGLSNPMWEELALHMDAERLAGAQQFTARLYGSTDERKIKFAESNASLFAMSIMYAAKYYGVESHAASGIDFAGIKQAFKLEVGKEVVMAISLGYFDESKTLYPRARRLLYHEIVTQA